MVKGGGFDTYQTWSIANISRLLMATGWNSFNESVESTESRRGMADKNAVVKLKLQDKRTKHRTANPIHRIGC